MDNLKEQIKERRIKKRPVRVFSYLHGEGRIGVLLEIESDTDFALRDERVKDFAHEVCLQIASMSPIDIDKGEGYVFTDPLLIIEIHIGRLLQELCEEMKEDIQITQMARFGQ